MSVLLKYALDSLLNNWKYDLDPAWRKVLGDVELGGESVDDCLTLESHEPIFPARKGFAHLGAPVGAHIFRAFDDIVPDDVNCIFLGQDPYPCMAFSTGRAFDCGSYACWRDFDDMFTSSMRCIAQCVFAERSGRTELADSVSRWPEVLAAIEARETRIEAPKKVAQRWVDQGVLLLNSSLTISRFAVEGDPHQVDGHLPYWQPLVTRVLQFMATKTDRSIPIVLFGDVAKQSYRQAESAFDTSKPNSLKVFETEHPAAGDRFLANGNPLSQCNEQLVATGRTPIRW